jgi:hypothetical protein
MRCQVSRVDPVLLDLPNQASHPQLLTRAMKRALAILTVIAAIVTIAGAATPTPTPAPIVLFGKYYREAKLVRVYHDTGLADLASKDGRVTVPIAALPEPLKSQAVARAKDQAEHDADRIARETKAASERAANPGATEAVIHIVHVLPEGILGVTDGGLKVLLKDHPNAANLADGERVTFRGVPEGLYKYQTTLGTEATARIYRVIPRN